MNTSANANPIVRFVALDIHKQYVMVGALSGDGEVLLRPRRVSIGRLPQWLQKHLRPTDHVVIEATTNAWHIYDLVCSLVARTVVAHPPEVKKIVNARVKTDERAVVDLARLLSANLIPEVWVPPVDVRELRSLVAHRWRLVKMSTMARNRLHSVVHRNNLIPPEGNLFCQRNLPWWDEQDFSPTERLRVQQDLATLVHFEAQKETLEQELARLSNSPRWADAAAHLLQIPGFGLLTGMTVLAAIGDIGRFPAAKRLVGYAGLGASVHDSGKMHRTGRITKQGRRELRWALIEAAWAAVRYDPYWKAEFQALKRRKHPNQAITAIARKLLVVIWHVLTKREVYHRSSEQQIAFKMLMWSWTMNEAAFGGLDRRQFLRSALLRLGIGDDMTRIVRGGRPYRVASVEEVLALQPDLRPSV
jgi:transposase